VGLRTLREEHDSAGHLTQRSREKAGNFQQFWKRGKDPDLKLTCSDVRSHFKDSGEMEDQESGKCQAMYDGESEWVVKSGSPCAEEVRGAVTKFCQELQRWDLINRILYGKQLRCTDADWDTTALQSIPAFKIMNEIQVKTTDEDWNSMLKVQSQLPIVEYLNIETMEINVDMAGPEMQDYDCVASDAEKKWGISPEMQDQAKKKSCKAWQMQQQDMMKEVTASATTEAAAYNFCRLFSQEAFHLKNGGMGDSELYFTCLPHPKNAFRLLACIGGICKLSTNYVHEVLGEGGFFNMSLSEENSEFLGPQWYLWGDVSVDGDTTMLRSDGLTVKLPHFTDSTKFSLKEADVGSIANVQFSPAAFEAYEAKKLQLQNPEEGDRLWDERCPKINKEWQRHPCAYEMAMWIADFCTTFSHEFEMQEMSKSSSKLKMQCVTFGKTSPMWITMHLLTLREAEDVGQQGRKGESFIYQFVDLDSQTINMPVEFGSGFDSCMNIDLPKRKAVQWRADGQKLVFSA